MWKDETSFIIDNILGDRVGSILFEEKESYQRN